MLRRDYLKKQIDELGKALEKLLELVLRLKDQGQASVAMEHVWQSLKEQQLDPDVLISLPPGELIAQLDAKGLPKENIALLAELFYQMAEIDWEENNPRAGRLYRQAAVLFGRVQQNEKDYSLDRYYKQQKALQRQS